MFHQFYTEHWKWNHCQRQSVVKEILDHIRTRGKNPHVSKVLYTYYVTWMCTSCIPVTLGLIFNGCLEAFFLFQRALGCQLGGLAPIFVTIHYYAKCSSLSHSHSLSYSLSLSQSTSPFFFRFSWSFLLSPTQQSDLLQRPITETHQVITSAPIKRADTTQSTHSYTPQRNMRWQLWNVRATTD